MSEQSVGRRYYKLFGISYYRNGIFNPHILGDHEVIEGH